MFLVMKQMYRVEIEQKFNERVNKMKKFRHLQFFFARNALSQKKIASLNFFFQNTTETEIQKKRNNVRETAEICSKCSIRTMVPV